MEENNKKTCIACGISEEEVPLIIMTYKGKELRICPQHIPVLIHEPKKLVGKIDAADTMIAG